MNRIKEFFIQQKLSKKRKLNGRKKLVKFNQIRNITILSDTEENSTIAQKAIAGLWEHELNIMFIYMENNPAYECYDYNDFNILGQPKEKIREIIAKPTDIVMVTHTWMDPLTAHLLKLMQNVYSMGFYNTNNEKYLDLMLEREEGSLEDNIKNLVKYLKKIS
ncbi:MAG TPA: hypothetical protein VK921_18860 [Anditalea sp.]|nr:hypothetical protein [Anditalea sp.]